MDEEGQLEFQRFSGPPGQGRGGAKTPRDLVKDRPWGRAELSNSWSIVRLQRSRDAVGRLNGRLFSGIKVLLIIMKNGEVASMVAVRLIGSGR
jgi:hypothetical protein